MDIIYINKKTNKHIKAIMTITQFDPDTRVICTQHGQKHAYGDSHYEYEIHTKDTLSDEDILKLTHEEGRLPYDEWKKRTNNMADYFKGYYTIKQMPYGYYYHGVYPYDD